MPNHDHCISHNHGAVNISTIANHTHGSGTLSTNSAGSHNHSYQQPVDGGTFYRVEARSTGLNTVGTSTSTGNAGSHSHSVNSGSTGGGGSHNHTCLLYTSPSPRDATLSRMPSSA